MSRDRCPRGGDHVWASGFTFGLVQCVACNKVGTYEEAFEGVGDSLYIPILPEPSKPQSPARGIFREGNVEAKKRLVFSNFDPATDHAEADLFSEQSDYRVNRVSVGWEVEAILEKMFAVMEKGNNLVITLEVSEDE